MRIGGFVPFSLSDFPGKVAAVVFAQGCNFRCPYCMPREVFGPHHDFLPRSEILTFEEIRRLAGIFQRLGVRKVRLTGGASASALGSKATCPCESISSRSIRKPRVTVRLLSGRNWSSA